MTPQHKLLSKDPNTATGVCVVCGPVDIVLRSHPKGRWYWRCGPARRDSSRRSGSRSRHTGLEIGEAQSRVRGKACEICGEPAVHLDHDHATKQVRGPLCVACNVRLLPLLETCTAEEVTRRIEAGWAYLANYTQT